MSVRIVSPIPKHICVHKYIYFRVAVVVVVFIVLVFVVIIFAVVVFVAVEVVFVLVVSAPGVFAAVVVVIIIIIIIIIRYKTNKDKNTLILQFINSTNEDAS